VEKLMSGVHPFEQVRRFMLAGDQNVIGTDPKQAELYANLVKEEIAEFWKGIDDSNAVEILDGICDSIWVLVGYAHSRGWNVISAFEEVARSNMSKVDIETGKLLKREDGKVLKPESYSPPNLAPFVYKDPVMPSYENIVMGLGEE
jgi:predicted HAD superfamily Cof-like phosphohydrolase